MSTSIRSPRTPSTDNTDVSRFSGGAAPSTSVASAGTVPGEPSGRTTTSSSVPGFAVVRDVVSHVFVDELRQLVDQLVDDDLAWRMAETQRRREAGEADVRPFPRGSEGRFGFKLSDNRLRWPLVESVTPITEAIGLPLRSGGGFGALPAWMGRS